MPPKKVEEPERKPLIGRVGTNLKVGIVGIPNVGKSTFFNVLTKSQAAAENFPFCTIDPNENNGTTQIEPMKECGDDKDFDELNPVRKGKWETCTTFPTNLLSNDKQNYQAGGHKVDFGGRYSSNNRIPEHILVIEWLIRKLRRVQVPDERFEYLCNFFKPSSKTPAYLNVTDIAGLVKGASEGQGLGNAFLGHIKACDALFHLCRAFEDDDVIHVEGAVDPVRDLDIISEELRLKDEEYLKANLDKLAKASEKDKKLKPEYDTLCKVKEVLVNEKKQLRFGDWSINDIDVLNKHMFLTSKPVIYLVNLTEKDYIKKKNKWLVKIKEWVDKNDPGSIIVPFSGAFENKLIDMDEEEQKTYCAENKVASVLDKIIVQGFKALQLEYFFTTGAVGGQVNAWVIQKGTKAPQAAGKIHTDFEKGFIMAEVMKFDDFKEEGSEAAVKAAGKFRQQGRTYTVEDGDMIQFKANTGAGLKDPKKK